MGLSISCPLAACTDLETSLSSIGFQEHDEAKSLIKSISFSSHDSESDVIKPVSSQKMRAQESFSLDRPESSPKHEAAIKLQKVYKSFRTRRKLADCAVLIEQIWLVWKVLDSAELKRSSISFFDIEKHESAVSRWARARTRAAKVGKGLSKNYRSKTSLWAQSSVLLPKLAALSKQRTLLLLLERKAYEVAIENGKFYYKQTGLLIDTVGQTRGAKSIFVLSTTKTLYVGIKKKGSFQHSSFLSGGAALAAGRIVAEKGVLKAVWPHSGHYRPTQENFEDFLSFLHENDVDTSNLKMDSNDDDDKEYLGKQSSISNIRTPSSEEDDISDKTIEEEKKPRLLNNFTRKLSVLEIPKNKDLFLNFKTEKQTTETMLDCYSDEEHELENEDKDSHKETKSFKLGRQISCKWSTGAGPRIGCLRDYPSELQSHALEEAKLSPRSLKSFNRRNSCAYRTQLSPLSVRSMNLVI
ncbi:hypothetical protein L1987_83961 [Smallanthus sonchifolius]|uniref:Uncharacterized protein n=1 Tax=Smallanthus sonchifolius TaxID=185202 RepID=A0ACB8YEB4_9ASTR|nr:hypothetical protein L1987_83961 [Smallanthus sonchifolius]